MAEMNQVLNYESVLPGLRGRVGVPIGPGRVTVFGFNALTVEEAFGGLGQMVAAREQWPWSGESFDGYLAIDAPGWELTTFFRSPAPQVEYHAVRSGGGERVAGAVRWDVLAQALMLSPDYAAVVGYLMLNPYRTGYVV